MKYLRHRKRQCHPVPALRSITRDIEILFSKIQAKTERDASYFTPTLKTNEDFNKILESCD